jgi:hypothetical protein
MRIGKSIKSGLCRGLKWRWTKTGYREAEQWFYIKVPNDAEAKEAVRFLNKIREPMATYFSASGHVQGWQWRLHPRDERAIWNIEGVRRIHGGAGDD